jgi:hypothetical protein
MPVPSRYNKSIFLDPHKSASMPIGRAPKPKKRYMKKPSDKTSGRGILK